MIADWSQIINPMRKKFATRLGFAPNPNARGSDLTPAYVKTMKKNNLGVDNAKQHE